MSSIVIGWIRTTVPSVVAFAISWLVAAGWIEETAGAEATVALASGLTAVLSSAYYMLVRLLAERFPWAGALLGVNQAPSYDA